MRLLSLSLFVLVVFVHGEGIWRLAWYCFFAFAMDHFNWCFDDLKDDLKDDSEPASKRLRTESGVHPILKAARTPRDIAHWRGVLFIRRGA